MTKATFVMAGGGTGGHVIPALAVAGELRARGHTVRFIGTRRGLESKLVLAENFPLEYIEIGGLKRVGLRRTLTTLAELPVSVWQAARMLERSGAAAVFSMGPTAPPQAGTVVDDIEVAKFLNRALDGALDVLLARHVGEGAQAHFIAPISSPVIETGEVEKP